MKYEIILGHYIKDAREHYPSYDIIEVEKDGVPQNYEESDIPSIKVSTQNGIITEIRE